MSVEADSGKGHTAQSGKTTPSVPRPNRQEHSTGRSRKYKGHRPPNWAGAYPRTAISTGIPILLKLDSAGDVAEVVASTSWLVGGIYSQYDKTSESGRNFSSFVHHIHVFELLRYLLCHHRREWSLPVQSYVALSLTSNLRFTVRSLGPALDVPALQVQSATPTSPPRQLVSTSGSFC